MLSGLILSLGVWMEAEVEGGKTGRRGVVQRHSTPGGWMEVRRANIERALEALIAQSVMLLAYIVLKEPEAEARYLPQRAQTRSEKTY